MRAGDAIIVYDAELDPVISRIIERENYRTRTATNPMGWEIRPGLAIPAGSGIRDHAGPVLVLLDGNAGGVIPVQRRIQSAWRGHQADGRGRRGALRLHGLQPQDGQGEQDAGHQGQPEQVPVNSPPAAHQFARQPENSGGGGGGGGGSCSTPCRIALLRHNRRCLLSK